MESNKNRKKLLSVINLTKAAMFIALMAISANLFSIIMIGPVPLTFQTLIAILAGVLLGMKLGTFAMVGYAIVGLLGAPIFANLQGGLAVATRPTFGFILSFIFIAFIVGYIIEKSKKRSTLTYFIACFAGLFINYGIGIPYLYLYSQYILELSDLTLLATIIGNLPFFIKDVIFTAAAASICPRLVAAVEHSKTNQLQRPA
ncbi:biotin transporter BioY [Evansella sp. AB-rgal1]|uniref:biotin transporter BioY n=1 Tax=Evansella sp. AB-rgal1 TaxID=3242696 RepID=UPI00359D713B